MGKHCQVVMGPAGTGKSTYCKVIQDHCATRGRTVHVVNLDPAAEAFHYDCSVDIRELVTLEDVMEEKGLGPNGGLVYCMEYLLENLDWVQDQLGDYLDDYLLFDLPGQIEIFTHSPVVKRFCQYLAQEGYFVCGVYLMDSTGCSDLSKFIAGSLMSLSAMMSLEVPHLNVLTKCDKLPKSMLLKYTTNDGGDGLDDGGRHGGHGHGHGGRQLEDWLECNFDDLADGDARFEELPQRYKEITGTIVQVLNDFNLVNFIPLNVMDEDSVEYLLSRVDQAIQYGEDLEPKEPKDEDEDGGGADGMEEEEGGGCGADDDPW